MTAKAREVLENLRIRNVVSWNALIATYVRNGEGHEAFISFECMQSEGISPDEATFVSILKACTTTGAIEKGKQVHNDILRAGLLGKSTSIGGALVNMYAKCGWLAKAEQVLDMLANRDAICWSALIAGYAQKRLGVETLDCFARMQGEGHSPDAVTFLCVLNACCHAGKLGEAQTYYENMSGKYGILPSLQHSACMMILYGHAGHFDKAMSVAKTMAAADDASLWFALLGTCCKWGNLKLGESVFKQATQHDKSLGSGIYSYG
jgi:pentatricopeptide repeat protein